jgi:LysR family hydrogen peroxide-inducible transcriptional activator
LEPSDLEGEIVHLLDEGHCFRAQALAVCSEAKAKETPFRATSLATLAQMVSSGVGITLLPSIAVPVENRRGQLDVRPFVKPMPGRTVALVWRRRWPFEAVFTELAKAFRGAAA